MTDQESASPTAPVAIYTGSSLTHPVPEYTGPAGTSGSSSSGSSSNGLSVGAKAGVGVGAVVGVLVLAGLLWFAYTMGKRRSQTSTSDPPGYDSVVHGEEKQSRVTLYSIDSSQSVKKGSATDKAHNAEKLQTSDNKV